MGNAPSVLPYGRPKYGIIDSCRVSHQAYDKNPKGRLKKYELSPNTWTS